jgi:iron complex outermembrane recepter protein
MRNSYLLRVVLVVLGMTLCEVGLVHAQATPSPSSDSKTSPELQEIVVTGTRIAGTGYDSPTPVTSVTAEQLNLAAPQGLSASLSQLPQLQASSTSTNPGSSSAGSVGIEVLNLRNLGAQRTLTLLDGQRPVPSTAIGTVDISTLPQLLVKQVDIVTGGASAAYGSDAVAGVVNIILDTDFSGLKGSAQGGISRYGDNGSYGASLAWGGDIIENLHFVASVDTYNRNGQDLNDSNRPWQEASPGLVNNPTAGALPIMFNVPSNVHITAATLGGLINGGPLQGTDFGPGGTIGQFNYGTDPGVVFGIGGDGPIQSISNTASIDRNSVFAHLKYSVSDNLSFFAQAQYAHSTTGFQQYYPWMYTATSATIFSGNPFIPPALQQTMTSQGIGSFPLAEIFSDFPPINTQTSTVTNQYTVGLNGKTGGWSYDAFASIGTSNQIVNAYNSTNFQTLYAALDAVVNPANGQIVCATALTGLTPGCVPLNPFGGQSASPAAIKYVTGNQFLDMYIRQPDFGINVRRDLFSLWSDPLKVAFGVEYRKLSLDESTDGGGSETINLTGIPGAPTSLQGRQGIYLIDDPTPVGGSFDVKEAYAEINVPVLKDQPFANLLGFDGAIRQTDYSTSGEVTTWKVGLNYKPIQDVRFRGTFSQDIRAPNITELYTGRMFVFLGQVNDPSTGAIVPASGFNSGNPNLGPEKAKTQTFGVVYTPTWLSGFQGSIDYWQIKISGAVSTLSPQQTADACFQGSAVACSNIIKTPQAWTFTFPELNLNTLETEGVDLELSYRQPMGAGLLTLHALATDANVYSQTVPGAGVTDMAGCVGYFCSDPKWTANFQVNYTQGPFGLFVQERYISNGKYYTQFVQGVTIDNNDVPSVFYTDLTLQYHFGQTSPVEAFLTVNNVFDKDPPAVPQNQAQFIPASNFALYDNIGRYFTAGVRFKF